MDNMRESIIQNYIDGYNEFDIEKMVRDLDDEIVFQNIQNKEEDLKNSKYLSVYKPAATLDHSLVYQFFKWLIKTDMA